MKNALLFLAEGFEEIEAIGTIDILRRGDILTTTVSITGRYDVTGAHGISVRANDLWANTDFSYADALILPGGMVGASNLDACEPLKELLVAKAKNRKLLAAICAAPMVLGGLGLLKGHRATCFPGFEEDLIGAIITDEPVETDGNIITGKGPGMVFDFALAIIAYLETQIRADKVAANLLLTC
ncbi:MAG: DJ-1/PfpI family protein [Tannerellaceae bacterium]|jgi:4-methyl-5(b-hydroxyethyl)-thiazole monophosphate biosynthesis|nr:DJ-1/PfpI family protein [Tannerellaceae bacterium]